MMIDGNISSVVGIISGESLRIMGQMGPLKKATGLVFTKVLMVIYYGYIMDILWIYYGMSAGMVNVKIP